MVHCVDIRRSAFAPLLKEELPLVPLPKRKL
jgi:hypothetical protein